MLRLGKVKVGQEVWVLQKGDRVSDPQGEYVGMVTKVGSKYFSVCAKSDYPKIDKYPHLAEKFNIEDEQHTDGRFRFILYLNQQQRLQELETIRVRAIIARKVPTSAQLKQMCDVLEIDHGLD